MVHNVAANTQTWITSPLLPLSTLSLATMRHDRAAIPALASAFRNCQWPFLAVSGVCTSSNYLQRAHTTLLRRQGTASFPTLARESRLMGGEVCRRADGNASNLQTRRPRKSWLHMSGALHLILSQDRGVIIGTRTTRHTRT